MPIKHEFGSHPCSWAPLWQAPAAEGKELWPLESCTSCGLVRLARMPSLEEAYPASYYGSASKKFLPGFEALSHRPPSLLPEAERWAARMAAEVGRSPRVLDVGCGRGYLLKRLHRSGWIGAGIDIPGSPIPSEDSGLECRHGDASTLPWADGVFDLVVINHVLEHVADPWLACREAARVLRPGGVLYVGVPNFGSWQRRLFREQWFPLEIPRHLFHFTPNTLSQVVRAAGLEPRSLSTWSLTQGTFGFLQSALNAADPSCRNAFLSLVKGYPTASWPRLVLHSAAACALLPAGVLETVLSSLAGNGPVIALIALKNPPSLPVSL